MDNYNVFPGHTGGLVKAWTNGVPVEEDAIKQLKNIASLPFIHKHVAVMPDVHVGKGATIGSVVPTVNAIIPAAVGVDLGCVDADTEFLSQNGWKRIGDYEKEDLVLQCDEEGNASYVRPQRYIKEPCAEFLWFKTKYGVNQMLSRDHKVLCWRITGRNRRRVQTTMFAGDLASEHGRLVLGARVEFKTTFDHIDPVRNNLGLSGTLLRIQVMLMADGSLEHGGPSVCIRLKKERKILRARELLTVAELPFTSGVTNDGVTWFRFKAPINTKTYKDWWGRCTKDQLQIITDECLHWDGNLENQCFYTRDKASADFIQYAFSATGRRAVLRGDEHSDGKTDYRVFAHQNSMVGISGAPKSSVQKVPSRDGFKYCFTLPSGFWVMRRGGNIALTGNCGMMACRTTLTAPDLPDNLKQMRGLIERAVPHGRNGTGIGRDKGAWGSVPNKVDRAWARLSDRFDAIVEKHKAIEKSNNRVHLGTLGTGNHFVEICLDQDDRVWVMLHSGSRGVGNRIGTYFIEKAKREMERWHIRLPDSDLAYLVEGSDYFDDYVEAVSWAQDFARINRELMMEATLDALRRTKGLRGFKTDKHAVDCHHNYVEKENHYGQNVWVTRKGAVRAREGDLGIIPGSMGAKSFIVRGKGNPDSFCSCSHGAGRKMSRSKAKALFTLDDHIEATKGIECRKDEEVIDETPAAYKDIDAVMAAQSDLVEVEHTLRQIVCVKG